jgi:hypothetical protein
MRQASTRCIAVAASSPVRPIAERNRGLLSSPANPGGPDVLIEEGFELVVRRHLVLLAAFLVEADPPALAVGEVVLDPHGDDSADASEGVGHDADQRAIAQAEQGRGVDAFDQGAGLVGDQHGGLATLDDVLWTAHRVGRVNGEDPAGHQPVEAHPDRREVLLDGRLGHPGPERLDIGGDVERLDVDELADLVAVDPGKEIRDGPVIGHAGIPVADGGGEEFQEAARRGVAGGGDDRRHRTGATRSERFLGSWDGELIHGR